MMKLIFLVLMGITYYIAGTYRNLPLMILFVIEAALFVVMFLLSLYFKKQIQVNFPIQKDVTEKDSAYNCEVTVKNKGKLPVNRLLVKMNLQYITSGNQGEKQTEKNRNNKHNQKYKSTNIKKKLYGACIPGASTVSFGICAPYCGLLQVKAHFVKVFDYMALFGAKTKLKEQMTIAIVPKEQSLSITLPSGGFQHGTSITDITEQQKGSAQDEIKQIREYRYGDQNRHIHWNQSARAEELYIKEFDKETDASVEVYLDYTEMNNPTIKQLSAFFEMTSALVTGLLHQKVICGICWYDESTLRIRREDVHSYEQWTKVLLKLYDAQFTPWSSEAQKEALDKRLAEIRTLKGNYFKVNTNLEMYYDDRLLNRFTIGKYKEELLSKVIIL